MKCLIFGCGYLGAETARLWNQHNADVTAVTRNETNANQFLALGYQAIVADVTKPETLNSISIDYDVVLFSVGFDRTRYSDIRDVYVTGLQNVLDNLQNFDGHFVYISSTGVFGDCGGEWVDEESETNPQRPGGLACLEAESLIRSTLKKKNFTILRLAGIYGPGRIPRLDAMLNKKWSELGQSGHVNLIHVTDAAAIIKTVADLNLTNQMFLVSDGQPANRIEFYEYIAKQIGSGPIEWPQQVNPASVRRSQADKKISNRKLLELTGYQFQFPSFKRGIDQSLNEKSA